MTCMTHANIHSTQALCISFVACTSRSGLRHHAQLGAGLGALSSTSPAVVRVSRAARTRKNTPPRRRRLRIQAFGASDQAVKGGLCPWIAGRRLAHRHVFFWANPGIELLSVEYRPLPPSGLVRIAPLSTASFP